MIQEKKKRVLTCAGAIIACLIGSGYATGQEILQFFVSYGKWGILGLVISIAGLVIVTKQVLLDAYIQKMEKMSEMLPFYCGKRVGRILEWIMPLILFSTLVVMISGAGTAMEEYYGWNPYVGRVLLLIPVYLTVVMGLDQLVEIIGFLGPFTIVFTLIICLYNVWNLPELSFKEGVMEGLRFIERMDMPRAAGHPFVSAVLYTSFNLTMSLAFFSGMGAHATSYEEAGGGSVLGAITYGVAAFFMHMALLLHLSNMEGVSIPMLHLADRLHPFFGYLFSLILISEIYTTAVPALWALGRNICSEDSSKFSYVIMGLLGLGFVGSLLPFEILVGRLYPLIGYVGIALLIGIVRKMVRFKN